jgi:hypothetical protein
MGGGLMQLVAYGAQDIYLTGNPQITFFKVVYRRHTNFSMEAIEQTLNGTAGYGNTSTSTISRNGDLVHSMYIEYVPGEVFSAQTGGASAIASNFSYNLINEVELEIGGQKIDKHYGHWLNVWDDLTSINPTGLKSPLTGTTGITPVRGSPTAPSDTLNHYTSYNHLGNTQSTTALSGAGVPSVATVPLQFWFCRNPGLALPLIALQYHEVKVKISLNGFSSVVAGSTAVTNSFSNFKLWCDYIYLDTDERRRFAQVSHEYLIEQLQFQTGGSAVTSDELNFNHPVKELIMVGAPLALGANITSGPANPQTLAIGKTYQLKLNGHDRFAARDVQYFTRVQVLKHHSGFGSTTNADSIGVYSFALKPEEHQPSGTCNFSRIDNAQFVHPSDTINYYAVNYNVLRIMSGMGGLAYSN